MSEQQRWKLNAALRLGCRIIMEQCKWKHCETSQVWDIETFHYGSGDLALTAWCGWCSSLAPPVLEQRQESHRACLTHRAVLFSEGEWGNAQSSAASSPLPYSSGAAAVAWAMQVLQPRSLAERGYLRDVANSTDFLQRMNHIKPLQK